MKKYNFVIHYHEALRAGKHWDVRFEIPEHPNNLWASFACRKEPPTEINKKILAVKTHLHTKEEALMLGQIEKGKYGAGMLSLWDQGKCEIIKYSSAHIIVKFYGKKIKGNYNFISLGNIRRQYFKQQHYLFFKGKE